MPTVAKQEPTQPDPFPLPEAQRRAWQRIRRILLAVDSYRGSRRAKDDIKHGRWCQTGFEGALPRLRSVLAANWTEMSTLIPPEACVSLDIRRPEWWQGLLRPAADGPPAQPEARSRRSRWVAVSTLKEDTPVPHCLVWAMLHAFREAVYHVLRRDYLARKHADPVGGVARGPTERSANNPHREFEAFLDFAIRRRELMMDMLADTEWESYFRHLFWEDMFPRYTADVRQTRLNRAIDESRRNVEFAILAPKFEALEEGLRQYGETFLSHPRGNNMPTEPTALLNAINALYPYLGPGAEASGEAAGAREDQEQAPPPPVWERLNVEENPSGDDIARLDHAEYRLIGKGGVFLRALQEKQGKMILAGTLSKAIGDRADHAYRALPGELQAIISKPGKGRRGYRMLAHPHEHSEDITGT